MFSVWVESDFNLKSLQNIEMLLLPFLHYWFEKLTFQTSPYIFTNIPHYGNGIRYCILYKLNMSSVGLNQKYWSIKCLYTDWNSDLYCPINRNKCIVSFNRLLYWGLSPSYKPLAYKQLQFMNRLRADGWLVMKSDQNGKQCFPTANWRITEVASWNSACIFSILCNLFQWFLKVLFRFSSSLACGRRTVSSIFSYIEVPFFSAT